MAQVKFAVMATLYYKLHVIWCDSCFWVFLFCFVPLIMNVCIPVAEAVNFTGIQLLGKQIEM